MHVGVVELLLKWGSNAEKPGIYGKKAYGDREGLRGGG